MQLIFFHTES